MNLPINEVLDPGSLLLHEYEKDLQRLERGLLLYERPYEEPRQGVGLHRLREMRKGLSPAPADSCAAERRGKGV